GPDRLRSGDARMLKRNSRSEPNVCRARAQAGPAATDDEPRAREGPGPSTRERGPHSLHGHERQRHRVDAVAKPGGFGAIVEHVAQVAAAARALDLDAHHVVGDVAHLGHHALERWSPETRPARARVELGVRAEQLEPAARAAIHTLPV